MLINTLNYVQFERMAKNSFSKSSSRRYNNNDDDDDNKDGGRE